MKRKIGLLLLLLLIILITAFISITKATRRIESHEFESLIQFLRAIDPENVLRLGHDAMGQNPCLDNNSKGVKCNSESGSIVEISLEKSNLSGVIDFGSLCKLSNLRVLNLAENRIRGNIPFSIAKCKKLVHLNLSNNLLIGMVPIIPRHIITLDLSNNNFEGLVSNSMKARALLSQEESKDQGNKSSESQHKWIILILIVLGFGFVLFIAYFIGKKLTELAKKREILNSLIKDSPSKTPQAKASEELGNNYEQGESRKSDLFFFDIEEKERFELDDLLEATTDLSHFGALFKVRLKNEEVYAVKRLNKLEISSEEFAKTMINIGNLKHENILPLVAYSSTHEDNRLLIYKYQNKGSLLSLLEDYIEGKREFKWGLRLSIIGGIARGLSFIYENSNGQREIIPHGNIKLSNILLDENEEPLISEFGLAKFLDPNGIGLCSTKGYTAPEKGLTEKSDVFSFGVVLLELLTGKLVEKTGVDLPKWVNAVIREEWTGEVFDKRLAKSATQLAFPLLNVALKCVSYIPENRPTFGEVLERIEEVIHAEEDHDMSTMSSINECLQDCCHLHSLIPDTWDTPGSNY